MQANRKLGALVFGGTGAVGRELVKALAANSRWGKIVCVVRRQLEEWKPILNQLQVIKVGSLDSLQQTSNWKFEGIDTVFCCLGTRVKEGEETFVKVDKTYPLWIADILKHNNIPHYSLVSSMGSNANSWFLYPRTKGQTEDELKKKAIPYLSIFRPGVLKNRYDARLGETIAAHIPFVPKIDVKEVAQVLIKEAELVASQPTFTGSKTYENKEMLDMLAK